MPARACRIERFCRRLWAIHGAVEGNGAELIHHCCDPNLVRDPDGDRMLFFSCRKISPGEELTVH
jgi:SET domain